MFTFLMTLRVMGNKCIWGYILVTEKQYLLKCFIALSYHFLSFPPFMIPKAYSYERMWPLTQSYFGFNPLVWFMTRIYPAAWLIQNIPNLSPGPVCQSSRYLCSYIYKQRPCDHLIWTFNEEHSVQCLQCKNWFTQITIQVCVFDSA